MFLTVIVLTLNEEKHIVRCLSSLSQLNAKVVVVDSGSTDKTVELASQLGAEVKFHKFINHSTQFNWALDSLSFDTQWVLRLDADEIVTSKLSSEIVSFLNNPPKDVEGVLIPRRMAFMGKTITSGGVFPTFIVRLFRFGEAQCENRWMDEHITIKGKCAKFSGEIIDNNLNPLGWWISKHNSYSSREVVDLLNQKYMFMQTESIASLDFAYSVNVKRWLKENFYYALPVGFRSFLYFFYRCIIRFGFLDGWKGIAFHFFQGLWYRYLIDAKFVEVESYMKSNNIHVVEAIRDILEIDVFPL